MRALRRKKEKGSSGRLGFLWLRGRLVSLLLSCSQAAAAFLPTHGGGAGAAPLIWYALSMCVCFDLCSCSQLGGWGLGAVGAGNVGGRGRKIERCCSSSTGQAVKTKAFCLGFHAVLVTAAVPPALVVWWQVLMRSVSVFFAIIRLNLQWIFGSRWWRCSPAHSSWRFLLGFWSAFCLRCGISRRFGD